MRSADGLRSCFGEAKMLHLALFNQFLYCPGNVLNRHLWIDTVLVEKVDDVRFKPLERCLGDLLDMFRPAIEPRLLARGRIEPETELRGYRHTFAHGSERFADQLFVGERTVHFGGIEERHAEFHSLADQGNHLLLVRGRPIAEAHAHATEADGRDLLAAFPECSLVHAGSPRKGFSNLRLGSNTGSAVARSFRFIAYSSCHVKKQLVYTERSGYSKLDDRRA